MAFLKRKNQCLGLLSQLSGKETTCQCRRHRFHPWSRKIPHATEPLFCSAAQELQLLTPWSPCSTREATAMRNLHTQLESSPHSLQAREKPVQQQRFKKKEKE